VIGPESYRSRQFGRTSAPIMPHPVQTMRGPNAGTGAVSGYAATLNTTIRGQALQYTMSERTPFARMLPSVMGAIVPSRGISHH